MILGEGAAFLTQPVSLDDCSIRATHILWDDGSNDWDIDSLVSSLIKFQGVDGFRTIKEGKTGGLIQCREEKSKKYTVSTHQMLLI